MKNEQFRLLVKEVAGCHICQRLVTVPHAQNSERLENDDHGLNTDQPYVNRWNLWQGDLNAEIMVIGQDYGTKEEIPLQSHEFAQSKDPTNIRLSKLFRQVLKIDPDAREVPLFFTNMANCYRKKQTSGGMHNGWLPLCAYKFMGRLIRIIRPKIIIVLGRSAFEAFHCMEDLPVVCDKPSPRGKDRFADTICYDYSIDLDGEKVAVFPVFHPGANSQRNRREEQQLSDWQRIYSYYEKIKQKT